MTNSEFEAQINAMIEAEYTALGGDKFRAHFGDEMVDKIVLTAYTNRLKKECERDPEFNAAWLTHLAGHNVAAYIADRRPVGAYREDGILELSKNRVVFMSKASRDHLIAWALCEDDERNLAYIRTTLDRWDAHPECKTLGELEGGS